MYRTGETKQYERSTIYTLPRSKGKEGEGEMREILFRAKAINRNKGYHRTKYKNGDWVYGLITRLYDEQFENLPAEMTNEYGVSGIEIDYKTIGEYTGINVGADKLFEGDIVEWHEDYDDTWGYSQTAVGRSVVIWDAENFCWAFQTDDKYIQSFNDWSWNNSYIIGNIHNNPELLRTPQNDEVRE